MGNEQPLPKRARADLQDGVECPFCSERDTKLVTPFGGQLSVAQYWCRKCRTGFDYLKWNA
jgi:hypothetical protein